MGFKENWIGSRNEETSPLCLPPDLELSIISTASSSGGFTSSRRYASKESLDTADFELSAEDIPEFSRVGKTIKAFEKLQKPKKCNNPSQAVGRNVASVKERKHEFTPSQRKTNAVTTQSHASSVSGQDDSGSGSEGSRRTSPFLKARSLDRQARQSIVRRLRERKRRNEEAVARRLQQIQRHQQSGEQTQSPGSGCRLRSLRPESSGIPQANKPLLEKSISATGTKKASSTEILPGMFIDNDKENDMLNLSEMDSTLSTIDSVIMKDSKKVEFQDINEVLYFERSRQEARFMFEEEEEDDNDDGIKISGEPSSLPSTQSGRTDQSFRAFCVVPDDITDITLFARGCVSSLYSDVAQGNCKHPEQADNSLGEPVAGVVSSLNDAINNGMIEIEMRRSRYPDDSSTVERTGEESTVFTGESSSMDSKPSRDTLTQSETDTEDWSDKIDTQRVYNPFRLSSIPETEEVKEDTGWERATSEATTNIVTNVTVLRHTSSCPTKFDVLGSFGHSKWKLRQNDTLDKQPTFTVAEFGTDVTTDVAVQDPSGAWPSEIGVWGVPTQPESHVTDHGIIAEQLGEPHCKNHIHLLEESFQES